MIRIIIFLSVLLLLYPTFSYSSDSLQTIHVIVSLCDNKYQGIVPVPEKLGNGDDPDNNLYWGAMYGVRSFFDRSKDWIRIKEHNKPANDKTILERSVWKHRIENVFLVADAYRGRKIKTAITNFVKYTKIIKQDSVSILTNTNRTQLRIGSEADLLVYIGHNGLMDFSIRNYSAKVDSLKKNLIILCCYSKDYFSEIFRPNEIKPLVWTNGLMAPEAYTLHDALKGWINNESSEQIRNRAAQSYSKYQKCSLRAAKSLLVSGW